MNGKTATAGRPARRAGEARLATSTGFGDEYVHVVEEVHTSNLMQGGTVNPLVRADMTLMYYPKGGAVWSTRGRWCILTGNDPDKHFVTIGMIDNPKNPGYPTYWHARGYGLFAANPLGRSIFDPKQPAFNYTIQKDQTATFRYRVILFSHTADAEEMNREADTFAADYK